MPLFALLDDNKVQASDKLPKHQKYICPYSLCHQPLFLVYGKKIISHFSHYKGTRCVVPHEAESVAHFAMKWVMKNFLSLTINDIEPEFNETYPDLGWTNKNIQYAIEVVHGKIPVYGWYTKTRQYLEKGIVPIWILHKDAHFNRTNAHFNPLNRILCHSPFNNIINSKYKLENLINKLYDGIIYIEFEERPENDDLLKISDDTDLIITLTEQPQYRSFNILYLSSQNGNQQIKTLDSFQDIISQWTISLLLTRLSYIFSMYRSHIEDEESENQKKIAKKICNRKNSDKYAPTMKKDLTLKERKVDNMTKVLSDLYKLIYISAKNHIPSEPKPLAERHTKEEEHDYECQKASWESYIRMKNAYIYRFPKTEISEKN